ncbi:hypothetical protein C0992_001118 [Termitomyces sp. T32_za158]|nr:hypothetical protein C0992_001118 [Termitomyces sp. T32_za158]
MPRRIPVEYTTYAFTASSGIDYNYDPSGSTSSEPAFDPYTDTYESPPPSTPPREHDWPSRYTRPHRHASRRTPSPPPRPQMPTSPSPEYIAESKKPSARLTVPTETRKLLILDLNGTLVYRTPHVQREFRSSRRHARTAQHHQAYDHGAPSYSQHDSRLSNSSHALPSRPHQPSSPTHADPTALRPLRVVHPRPYIRAFREYLFHPTTRAWLDTMVWSSAQPHSVADMVNRCFGHTQHELLAVWARDTLGLEDKDYSKPLPLPFPLPLLNSPKSPHTDRKTQTTKNLTKPWSELRITPSSSSSRSPSSDPNTPQFHSARTTLLMDDSPLKAYLQPYNHLCVREYTGALRQVDIQCRQREQRLHQILNSQAAKLQADTDTSSSVPEPHKSANKKRKRPKKKHAAHEPAEAAAEAEDDTSLGLGLGGYDPTLLAIVGVLEEIKWEGNVAGWVRSGGLAASCLEDLERRGGGGKEDDKEEDSEKGEEEEEDKGEEEETKNPNITTDANANTLQDPKRRRVSNDPPCPFPPIPHTTTSPSPPSSPSLTTATTTATATATATSTATTSTAAAAAAEAPTAPETLGDTGQWFEDEAVMRFWVRRGVEALEGLGVEVVSGVVA